MVLKSEKQKKKKKKKGLSSFPFSHLPFFTFPFTIFLLFFSIFTTFPFIPCLFFPGRSEISLSEISGGTLPPACYATDCTPWRTLHRPVACFPFTMLDWLVVIERLHIQIPMDWLHGSHITYHMYVATTSHRTIEGTIMRVLYSYCMRSSFTAFSHSSIIVPSVVLRLAVATAVLCTMRPTYN